MTKGKRRYLVFLVECAERCQWCKRMWPTTPYFGYCDYAHWAEDADRWL